MVNHSTAFGGRDTIKVLMALLDEEALTPLCKNKADLLGEDQPVLSGTEGTSVLMLFRLVIQYKLGFDLNYFCISNMAVYIYFKAHSDILSRVVATLAWFEGGQWFHFGFSMKYHNNYWTDLDQIINRHS